MKQDLSRVGPEAVEHHYKEACKSLGKVQTKLGTNRIGMQYGRNSQGQLVRAMCLLPADMPFCILTDGFNIEPDYNYFMR